MSGAGFVGVNLPAEHGGGGMGISELAIVTEELAAHGCPLLLLMVSPAICGTLLARFGTPAQRERYAADRLGRAQDGVRHHRARRLVQHPPAGDGRDPDGDGWRLSGRKYYISGPTRPTPSWWSAAPGPRRAPAGAGCRCSSSTPTPPGWTGP